MYYPSLHHISVEIEEGTTAERKPVKYGFDLNMFPSYSWKGYVNFSPKQVQLYVTRRGPSQPIRNNFLFCFLVNSHRINTDSTGQPLSYTFPLYI